MSEREEGQRISQVINSTTERKGFVYRGGGDMTKWGSLLLVWTGGVGSEVGGLVGRTVPVVGFSAGTES